MDWYTWGVIITAICLAVIGLWYKYRKNLVVETQDVKRTLKPAKTEVLPFNHADYLKQLFNNTFFSIMNDDGWKSTVQYGYMEFIKQKPIDKHNSAKLTVKVDYDFYTNDNKEMTIREVVLKSDAGYDHNSFKFEGPFNDEFYDYVYNIYKTTKEAENVRSLKIMEDGVKSINNLLGKSVERGSKLDDLLD